MFEIPEIQGVTPVNLIVTLTVKPEFVVQVKETFAKFVTETRNEEGNIKFEPMQAVECSTTLVVVETWRSKKDLQLHFDSAHFKEAMKEMEGKTETTVLAYFKRL